MPPRKRKAKDGSTSSETKRAKIKASENITSVPVSVQDALSAPPLAVNDFPTEDTAMLSLPPEIIDEIMKFYPEIFVGAPKISNNEPVLSSEYLQRTRALRSLSQVSRAYRNTFLPLLWETINICCCKQDERSFYKTLGETMIRYTSGLEKSPALKPFIRYFPLRHSPRTISDTQVPHSQECKFGFYALQNVRSSSWFCSLPRVVAKPSNDPHHPYTFCDDYGAKNGLRKSHALECP